ncbi:MCP four helix bundle domain-containing protein [Lacihabitans lacunae]|uniref:MCP four helix bundle domain-containing protein n=1 Tax=Lacihabitans lacunae TaxID=1028214 RepID=A0ABV7YQB6_9BACT
MNIFTKIRWVASILLVFFIVLITNIIDRDNFNRLTNSVKTMFEDRIVASDLLFDITRIIKEKQIAILTSDTNFFKNQNNKLNQEIDQLLDRYEITKLTEKEKRHLNLLQEELKTLKQKEKSDVNLSNGELIKSIEIIDEQLYKLSKIQLQEGKEQVLISNKAKDTINLYTQGEIIFLIIMAVLVQIIILYKPKE